MFLTFLCYVYPPMAVLLCGRPFLSVMTFFLWICPWSKATPVAIEVVKDHYRKRQVAYVLERKEESPRQKKKLAPLVDHPHQGMNGTMFRRK